MGIGLNTGTFMGGRRVRTRKSKPLVRKIEKVPVIDQSKVKRQLVIEEGKRVWKTIT